MTYEPPAVEVAAHVTFGIKGNASQLLLDGWSVPETGYIWSIGDSSRVRLPYRRGRGTLMLELGITPMILDPVIRSQNLTVLVNGEALGTETIAGECTLSFAVPLPPPGRDGELIVTLRHPDAVSPLELGLNPDPRKLGFAVKDMMLLWVGQEAAYTPRTRPPLPGATPQMLAEAVRGVTALSPASLMENFESIGHNCELGFVQRALGAEPLGLLRFGGISPHNLLRGLDTAFEGIDDPSRLRVYTEHNRGREEYLVRDDRYAVQFHTNLFEGDVSPEAVRAKWSVHLRFLQRKFQETLALGNHVFVLHDRACVTPAQVLPILNVLRSHGANSLLYVTESRTMAAGTVEQTKPDLFHGHIDLLAPMHDPAQIRVGAWLSLCANTYRMWREGGGGA